MKSFEIVKLPISLNWSVLLGILQTMIVLNPEISDNNGEDDER